MSERRPSPAQIQAACDWFNARYQPGDDITVYTGPVGEHPKRATVRYPAQILSDHTAVVYVTGGHHGCVALTHTAPLPAFHPKDQSPENR